MADEIYVGVDLAAADKKTGMCVLTWPDQLKIFHVVEDGQIREELIRNDLTAAAIDAPFGWPVAFTDALRAWDPDPETASRTGPYDGDYPTPDVRERLCYRHTDRFVRFVARDLAPENARPGWPVGLSVSTNRIGATALRAVGLLHDAAPDLRTVADWSSDHRLVEAYPATTLRGWGIRPQQPGSKGKWISYKGTEAKNLRVRVQVVEEIHSLIEPHNTSMAREIDRLKDELAESDDALDAFVCVLVARAWHNGLTWSLDNDGKHGGVAILELLQSNDRSSIATDPDLTAEGLADVVEREGWIAHPYASLENVVRI